MGDYLSALSVLGQWQYWIALCAGVFLVGTIGLIPGVGITTVAAVALPFLLFNIHEPLIALTFLAAVGGVANTLDSVPAILLGYPSAATQVTFLEGHQLAMQGRAAHTLGAVYAVSAVGGIVGAVCLLIAMPFIRPILTRISFPEIAAMALFGVLMVSALSRGAMLKGLIGGFLGILIGSIGTSYISGTSPVRHGGNLPVRRTAVNTDHYRSVRFTRVDRPDHAGHSGGGTRQHFQQGGVPGSQVWVESVADDR